MIGQFVEMVDQNYGVIQSTSGSTSLVRVLSTLDRELLKTNATVATHRHSHSVRPNHGISQLPVHMSLITCFYRSLMCFPQRLTPPFRPCK